MGIWGLVWVARGDGEETERQCGQCAESSGMGMGYHVAL